MDGREGTVNLEMVDGGTQKRVFKLKIYIHFRHYMSH